MTCRIPFGNLKIGDTAREYIDAALAKNWISEGDNVRLFEEQFSKKFGWKHAIATSSGTDAGIVVWSAARELSGKSWGNGIVLTPACAFVATANCLLASGCHPRFIDIETNTLNMNPSALIRDMVRIPSGGVPTVIPTIRDKRTIGIQFVATMGKPTPIGQIAAIADEHDLWLIYDGCEAHGATVLGGRQYADKYADAAIYSFYAAHMIVGGEGGIICTDDDELAELCRSIKSHGRPVGSNYFDFQRIGTNSKWTELNAAIALEGLEKFDENFAKRREVRRKLIKALSPMEDNLILYRDAQWEVIAPHAFCIMLRDENDDIMPLYHYMESRGIEVKKTFGSLPTQHECFAYIGHKLGDFPIAERIGHTSLHFSCSQFIIDEDVEYITKTIGKFFVDNA